MKDLFPLSPIAILMIAAFYSAGASAELTTATLAAANTSANRATVFADQTIVVEKKEKRQQEVQAATSLLPRSDLQDSGVSSLEDLNTQVPNLNVHKAGGASESFISIRGIVAQRQVMTPSGIGVYIDGVNYLDPLSLLTYTDLIDLDRVEVLRGPQGTLYGRNAEAGIINILTRKPEGVNRLYGEITQGNYSLQKYQLGGEANLIDDTLSAIGSGMWMQRNGLTKNTFLDRDQTDLEQYFLRGRLRWTPSENTEVLLNIDGHSSDDGPQDLVFITDGDKKRVTTHKNNYDFFGKQTHEAKGASVQWTQHLDEMIFTSISAVRDSSERTLGDADFTRYDLYIGDFKSDQQQYTQEFRLASDNDAPWQWLMGGYGFRLKNDFTLGSYIGQDAIDGINIVAPMDINSRGRFVNHGVSLFGETSWTFDNGFSITGGLRWETETAKSDEKAVLSTSGMYMPYGEYHGKKTFNNWLPKLALGYQLNSNINVYTSVAKGARAGGFNSVAQVPQGNSYDPEFSTNYEIGMKSLWLDNRLMLNLSIFQTYISDLQVARRIENGTVITTNAGKARNRGAELEMLAWPLESDFQLGASVGYVKAEYTDYTDLLAGTNYNGKRIPLVPEYTMGLSAQYRTPLSGNLDAFMRAEWQYVDKTYWDDANQYAEPAYDLINLRVGVEAADWQFYLWTKNLLDRNYVRTAIPDSGLGGIAASWGEQRTFGATLRYEF